MDIVIVNTSAVIEHDCVLETSAVISPAAYICGNVTIAAGAVVVDNVKANMVIAGIPAKELQTWLLN